MISVIAVKLSESVYIIEGVRTPVGSPFHSLKEFKAAQLGSFVIRGLLKKVPIKEALITHVILGNVVSAGLGQNLSRQSAVLAGLPNAQAFTVNNVCGSPLQALIIGLQAILIKEAVVCIAGGVESATHNPYLVSKELFSLDPKT